MYFGFQGQHIMGMETEIKIVGHAHALNSRAAMKNGLVVNY